ncbi:MAG TPA: UrcA family protein [Allosphingosinicella sp.]
MKTVLALAALAAAFTAAPASAREPIAVSGGTIAVRTADLDLSTDRGVSKLDRRIRAAATLACGTTSDFDVRGKNKARRCRAETIASVAPQRDAAIAPTLSTRLAAK